MAHRTWWKTICTLFQKPSWRLSLLKDGCGRARWRKPRRTLWSPNLSSEWSMVLAFSCRPAYRFQDRRQSCAGRLWWHRGPLRNWHVWICPQADSLCRTFPPLCRACTWNTGQERRLGPTRWNPWFYSAERLSATSWYLCHPYQPESH